MSNEKKPATSARTHNWCGRYSQGANRAMIISNQPEQWDVVSSILEGYDISSSDILNDWKGRSNVLISDPIPFWNDDQSWIYNAHQLSGGLHAASSIYIVDDSTLHRKFLVTKDVEIRSDFSLECFVASSRPVLLWNAHRLFEDEKYIITVEKGVTMPIQWNVDGIANNISYNVCDIFCGGFGGWGLAIQYMASYGLPICQVSALDYNTKMCKLHHMNHGGSFFTQANFDQMKCAPRPVHLCKGLSASSMITLHLATQPDIWVFSPPCPPWSTSGWTSGLTCEDGRTFLHIMGLCKICRPFAIGIENVASIINHRHYPCLIKVIKACGYFIVWNQAIDLNKITPANRKRWLLVAVDYQRLALVTRIPKEVVTLPDCGRATLGSYRCIFESLPLSLQNKLVLTKRMMDIYSNPRFCKDRDGVLPLICPKQVIESRIYCLNQKVTTFMAAYGSQHDLPERL